MAFSASDAAFEGFRVVRRHPFALVFWALLYVVLFGAVFALVGGSMVSMMAASTRLEAAGPAVTMDDLRPLMQSYAMMVAVLAPLGLVVGAVLGSAVSRAVLRPTENAFGYLRLGADEMRVLGVTVVIFFIMLAVMAVFGVLIGGAAGFASGTPSLWIVVGLLCILAFCVYIWVAIRLSLAVPATISQRRMVIGEAFRLSKGRFWSLLGMALLAFVMSIVVSILGGIVSMPIRMMTGGIEGLEKMDGDNMMAMLQTAWPAIAAWVVIQSIISALQLAVLYAPFSAAYRDITGGKPNADVFE